ncbi:hypothetical protein DNU06_14400 [Putridiphycobacter roseus]|uniref:Uncharacterized protein n=1 Tax=Putridiphycobacter roseus TaxID=2219161 RepID=A0A2W1NKG0_9FLAO|nr:hypothetical protein [Putridiphycobacter roseus]PZE16152.1 hypothetical protein DNU06_14400 [Putridiphycobacter roseus]
MGIKSFIILLVLTTSFFSFCQTEEQRKYAIQNFEIFKSFILSKESNEALLTHFHAKDIYLDIYLDTPSQLLLKNNLSLRFRKRMVDSTNSTYAFQLKNEMDSINSLRMEVEEKELYFYYVQGHKKWIPLTDILDSIFYPLENHSEFKTTATQNAVSMLLRWIHFKANGAIAPFQKLIALGFKVTDIQSLKPELFGKSTRLRSHIYANNQSQFTIGQNKIKIDKLPVFFQENRQYNWLLESSLDSSVFFKEINGKILNVKILEYEVENKYYQKEMGSSILYFYEKYLMKRFNLSWKKDSKYKQACILFSKL